MTDFRTARQPGSERLKLAPLPAWATPRVGQDQRRRLSWTLLHLGPPVGAAHLGLDLPQLAVCADENVAACQSHAAVPPVMLNSHSVNPKADIDELALGNLANVSRHQGGAGQPNRQKSPVHLRGP